jgi:hypothetical protein
VHSAVLQGVPQNREHLIQAPVDVEERREFHELGYLTGGEAFSETEAEEQAVTRLQAFERVGQCTRALGPGEYNVRGLIRGGREQGGVHLGGHEVNETPAASALLSGEFSRVGFAGSAIAVPMMIQTQPTHHDDEPEGERPDPGRA